MTNKNKKNKFVNIRTVLFFIVLVLGGCQLFISCGLSTYGEEISKLSANKSTFERENQQLKNKLAKLSSLSTIQSRAENELGMIHPEVEVFSSRRLAQQLEVDE